MKGVGMFGFEQLALAVLLVFTQVSSLTKEEWCANPNNTCCKLTQPKASCTRIRSGITNLKVSLLTYKANSIRSNTSLGTQMAGAPGPQPGATDMNFITWDKDMAECAQRWCDQCNSSTNALLCVTPKIAESRQIFWAVSVPIANLNDPNNVVNKGCEPAFDAWGSQAALYDKANVGKSPLALAVPGGTYARLVIAKATVFGCGWTQYTATNSPTVTALCNCYIGSAAAVPGPLYTQASSPDDSCSTCSDTCEDGLCPPGS